MFARYLQQKLTEAARENLTAACADLPRLIHNRRAFCELAALVAPIDQIVDLITSPQTPGERILAHVIVATALMKDPGRQTIHEQAQYDFLRSHGIQIQLLPKHGSRSLHIADGVVGTTRGSTKSIDAIIEIGGVPHYATMKYTKDSGGAQDNQCADVRAFIDAANGCNAQFIALLDGPYYEGKFAAKYNNVYVFTSDQLVEMAARDTKRSLGQFYTTNWERILGGLKIPTGGLVVEPFAGRGDLLPYIRQFASTVRLYDKDPKAEGCIMQNTLRDYSWLAEPCYVITNPPYLAKNKAIGEKAEYATYGTDDLYKEFMSALVSHETVLGGVVIIPLNFLTCREPADVQLRAAFFDKFGITGMNIFEESVFADTDYTVIAFSFARGCTTQVDAIVWPAGEPVRLSVDNPGRMHGDSVYNQDVGFCKFGRLLAQPSTQLPYYTNMRVFAIDSGTPDGRIRMELCEPICGKHSDRTAASLISNIRLPIGLQKQLVGYFNWYIESVRGQYRSMFLNNYRNSTKHYARKRISFELVYDIMSAAVAEYQRSRPEYGLADRIGAGTDEEVARRLASEGVGYFTALRTARARPF